MPGASSAIPNALSMEELLGLASHFPTSVRHRIDVAKYCNPAFASFLRQMFIVPGRQHPPSVYESPDRDNESRGTCMSEIVNVVVATFVEREKFKKSSSKNVLTYGYRTIDNNRNASALSGLLVHANGVESYYPNHLLNHFAGEEWERLLELIGEAAMLWILKSCLFIRHASYFVQIAGSPITTPGVRISTGVPISPCDRTFRHRMLYANCWRSCFIVGLPPKHPLNKLSEGRLSILAAVIFGNGEITKRMRPILGKFCTLLWKRHRSCHYSALFNYHCRDDSVGASFHIRRGSALSRALKPRQVCGFVRAVLRRLLAPKEQLAKSLAFKMVCHQAQTWITLRRFESLDAEQLMKGLSTRGLWALFCHHPEPSYMPNRNALHAIGINFLRWLLNHLIVPLIRHNFYASETSMNRNRLSFWRLDTWKRLFSEEILHGRLACFLKVSKDSHLSANVHNVGLRLLPKDSGFRPIINMKRQNLKGGRLACSSDKGLLFNVHAILNYYRSFRPHLLGASLISMSEVYDRLRTFKESSLRQNARLYAIRMDIQNCFDSIPHEKLLTVIDQVLDSNEYVIRRFEVHRFDGQSKSSFRRFAFPACDPLPLPVTTGRNSSVVVVDRVTGQLVQKSAVLKTLSECILKNSVILNGHVYERFRGIPQGSIVSSLLCALFYADMDRTRLAEFVSTPETLLMRYVDDMLLMTYDRDLVDRFLTAVSVGFAEYGVQFNFSKTAANFAHPLIKNLETSDFFTWCGLSIDMRHLTISADYSKFYGLPIRDGLSIEYTGKIVDTMRRYMRMYPNLVILCSTR